MSVVLCFVEGNIGVGKTSFLTAVAPLVAARLQCNYKVVLEDVDSWMNVGGSNLLKLSYTNPVKYGPFFQINVLASLAEQILNALREPVEHPTILFCERSLMSNRFVFGRLMIESGNLPEPVRSVYTNWWTFLHGLIVERSKDVALVFLHDTPEACAERITSRSRNGEESVTVDYLRQIEQFYNDLLVEPEVQASSVRTAIDMSCSGAYLQAGTPEQDRIVAQVADLLRPSVAADSPAGHGLEFADAGQEA